MEIIIIPRFSLNIFGHLKVLMHAKDLQENSEVVIVINITIIEFFLNNKSQLQCLGVYVQKPSNLVERHHSSLFAIFMP